MNNSGQVLLYIIILLISLATANWFYNNFEWVNEEKDVGFQGIARTNNLLASEFFLRKMGVQVQQVNGLVAFRDLPSAQHTLLIATQRNTLNKELSQKLLSWVRSGGHLIVQARSMEADDDGNSTDFSRIMDDPLLEPFLISSEDSSFCGCSDEEDLNEKNNDIVSFEDSDDERSEEEDIPVTFSLNLSPAVEIKVNFPYELSLKKGSPEPEISWLVKDDVNQYLMQFSLEQGLITVLTSTSMFNNEYISQHDHARFLHHLVQQPGHDAGVWLIRVDDMPPLWEWLWKNAWYAMFALSLLFILWLWRAPLRFGPLLNDESTARRSLLEHVQASGYYRWHNSQSGYLLAKVQDLLWDKIHKAHPAIRRENQKLAYIKLEEITGIKQSLIEQSLMVVDKVDEQEFVKRIRMLEAIRKHL